VAFPVLEGHISHKRFEPPLIPRGDFEDNADKQRDEYGSYENRIRLKSELVKFESNARVNRRASVASPSTGAAGSAVNAELACARPPPGMRAVQLRRDSPAAGRPPRLPAGDAIGRQTTDDRGQMSDAGCRLTRIADLCHLSSVLRPPSSVL
jgi:hypothetical protein